MLNTKRLGALSLMGLLAACGQEGSSVDATATTSAALAAETTAAWGEALSLGEPSSEDRDLDLDQAEQAYMRRSSCVQRTRSGGILRLDFGTGCPLGSWVVSGALTIQRSAVSGAATLTLGYEQLSVGIRTLTGTTSVTVRRGQVDQSGDLTVDDGVSSIDLQYASTVQRTMDGIAFDGTASRDDGVVRTDLEAQGVSVVVGDLCPSAGTVTLERTGQPTTLVTFSSATPVSGEVSVQVGRLPPQTVVVPACL